VQFYVVPDEYNHAESSLKMLRFLIARGAQINARDSDGKTALMLSLISDYDYKDYQKGLLNFNFKLEAMKFLIENGALVNARDKRGKTALMLATMAHYGDGYQEQWEKKRWAALRYLLDHGAQINARDDDGWTPLMHAVANYERFNVQGGSVYAPDPKDELVTVQYLLKRGADPNVRAKNGISALQLARDEPFMLGVLRKAGAR
jgi:ankyrin repeat protein